MKPLIHAHVVLNPAAGRGAAARALDPIAREFHRQGWSVDVERTEGPGHGAELAARAVQAGAQRIVAVGGDGTVHDVANGVLRHGSGGEVALGVVPIGTGNDFAKLAGVYRHSPVRAVQRLVTARTARFDAGRSEEHTSELQSPCNLVCRLLLEKKKKKRIIVSTHTRSALSPRSLR